MSEFYTEDDEISIQEKPSRDTVRYYQRGPWIFELSRTKHEKEKYVLNISNAAGEKLGYMAFYIVQPGSRISFSGIYLNPNIRSQGLSKVFLKELEVLASEMGCVFLQTKPQYKPLTCSVLVKTGFEPHNGFPNQNRVFVGRTELPGYIGVHFENPRRRSQFETSTLGTTQPYITCGFHELESPTQVVLGTSYRKNELVTCRAQ